ncbi:MAG TPA: glycoside hydrolase family 3 C-terminal domain-containing protein [Phnomibacter sp.]|nr:glycoside hydrolase family 3 C-terminal domain-containing protein [Phnomibacter sp.]
MIADFSSQDDIILDLIFGKFKPTGKLPFELPSSMEAVNKQKEDLPYDSKDPLYRFGSGLGY